MSYLGEWIEALLTHWLALMSCAVFTALGVIVLAFKRSDRWALWATFGLSVMFLLLASFLAWQDEHRKRITYEAMKLSGKIEMLSSAPAGASRQDSLVTVVGAISNPSGPPTIANNWQVYLKLKDRVIVGRPILIPKDEITLERDAGPGVVLSVTDYFPKATASQPIPTGGARNGWIMNMFRGISQQQINSEKPTVSVQFKDVLGNEYSMEQKFGSGTPNIGLDPFSSQPWNGGSKK